MIKNCKWAFGISVAGLGFVAIIIFLNWNENAKGTDYLSNVGSFLTGLAAIILIAVAPNELQKYRDQKIDEFKAEIFLAAKHMLYGLDIFSSGLKHWTFDKLNLSENWVQFENDYNQNSDFILPSVRAFNLQLPKAELYLQTDALELMQNISSLNLSVVTSFHLLSLKTRTGVNTLDAKEHFEIAIGESREFKNRLETYKKEIDVFIKRYRSEVGLND